LRKYLKTHVTKRSVFLAGLLVVSIIGLCGLPSKPDYAPGLLRIRGNRLPNSCDPLVVGVVAIPADRLKGTCRLNANAAEKFADRG
jgi:hypothetical protein